MIINNMYEEKECRFIQSCVEQERCVACASPFDGEQRIFCDSCAEGLETGVDYHLGWYRGAVAMLVLLRNKEQSRG